MIQQDSETPFSLPRISYILCIFQLQNFSILLILLRQQFTLVHTETTIQYITHQRCVLTLTDKYKAILKFLCVSSVLLLTYTLLLSFPHYLFKQNKLAHLGRTEGHYLQYLELRKKLMNFIKHKQDQPSMNTKQKSQRIPIYSICNSPRRS